MRRAVLVHQMWLALVGLAALAMPACTATRPGAQQSLSVERVAYRGWKDSIRMQNPQVEVIIAPAIGRIMSFRFRDGENVFWEDTALSGRHGDAGGSEWINFGGDKSWPSPEAEWKEYTKYKEWMPPPAFDALPVEARIDAGTVVVTSAIDPFYGIRTTRRITLEKAQPVMRIETTYERVTGKPSKIGIWVITQFRDAVAVYVPIPARSRFANGHFTFREGPWPQATTAGGLIKIMRDPATSHKLGSDADQLLWIGETTMCLVTSPRISGAEYPDRGASAEVYTNPDPKKYVELEMLGPLFVMKPGDRISRANTYVLIRRSGTDAGEEAGRVLKSNKP